MNGRRLFDPSRRRRASGHPPASRRPGRCRLHPHRASDRRRRHTDRHRGHLRRAPLGLLPPGECGQPVGNSNDSLVASVNFNRDVQSAEQMTTQSIVACGPSSPTPPQTQLLGLRWGANSAATAYRRLPNCGLVRQRGGRQPQTNKTAYNLVRQECMSGTTTPDSSFNVAHNIGTPTVTVRAPTTRTSRLRSASWTSAQGVTGVTFKVQAPDSSSAQTEYSYSLVGLPGQSTSQSSASTLSNPTGPGCGFAAVGSGTYVNQLCFADFTGFNGTQHSSGQCQTLTRPIANSPYSLSYCISVSGTNVTPAAIPTYYDPSGDHSEAFLGNNGFYTGIPGDPALYQTGGNGVSTSLPHQRPSARCRRPPGHGLDAASVTGDTEVDRRRTSGWPSSPTES